MLQHSKYRLPVRGSSLYQLIKHVYQNKNQSKDTISTRGWIQTIRSSKHCSFIELNDGSFPKNLQIVVDNDKLTPTNSSGLLTGASIEITGKLNFFRNKSTGEELPEIHCDQITLIGSSDGSYPVQKKFHTKEFLREIPHLRPRTRRFASTMRVRSQANLELLNFFSRRNFVQIHTPIITSSDCEGSGDLFQVAKAKNSNSAASTPEDLFFNSPAFLGVSGQLHAEAFACSMSNVFTFGPTFRAEASQTQQHLAEFWMLEPEMSHASLEDCMNLTRDMIVETTNRLFETHSEDLAFLHNFPADGSADTVHNLSAQEYLKPFLNADSFHVISYTEAIEILQNHKASLQTIPNWDEGFSREHELYLVNQIFNGNPVFVIDYPTEQKAFYMKKNPDQKTVRCMDLLVPIVGEIAGGSEREDSYEVLSETMRQRNLGQNGEYDWYLDLRKFGSVPHAGFGLGFERYLQLVTATRNIRDVIPVPRAYRHCQL